MKAYIVEVLIVTRHGSFWQYAADCDHLRAAVCKALLLAIDHSGGNVRITSPDGQSVRVCDCVRR